MEIKAERAATEALTTTIKTDVLEKTKALGAGIEGVDEKIDALGSRIDAAIAQFAEQAKELGKDNKAAAGTQIAAVSSSEIFRAFDRISQSVSDVGSLLTRLDARLSEARAYNFTGTTVFAPVNGSDIRDLVTQLSRQSDPNLVEQLPVYSAQSEPASNHEVTAKLDDVRTEVIEKILQFEKGVQQVGFEVESLESKVQRAFEVLSARIEHLNASQEISLRAALTQFYEQRNDIGGGSAGEVALTIAEMSEDEGLLGSMRANIEALLEETGTPTLLTAQKTLEMVEEIRARLADRLSKLPEQLVETVDERVAQLEARLTAVEANIESSAARADAKLELLSESISRLLERATCQIEAFPLHFETRFSAFAEQLASLESNISSNKHDLMRFALAMESASSEIENKSHEQLRALDERLNSGLRELNESVNNKLVDQISPCAKEQTIEGIVEALGAMFADVVFEIERRAPTEGWISSSTTGPAAQKRVHRASTDVVTGPDDSEIESMRAQIESMQLAIEERDAAINELRARLRSGDVRKVSSLSEAAPKASSTNKATFPRPAMKPALASKLLQKFQLDKDWSDWHAHQSAELTDPGVVVLRQSNGSPGVLGPAIAFEGGGLVRVIIDIDSLPETGCRANLRLLGDDGKHLGPDVRLKVGKTEAFFFAPFRTKSIRAGIVVFNPTLGYSLKIQSVSVEEVDQESYYRFQRQQGVTEPIIASMASVPARESMLRDTVTSLLLSCDVVRVFMNAYPEVPDFLDHPRVQYRRSQDWDDKGDAGKFGWIDEKDEPGYRVIVDDDLIFPPDFAAAMARKVASYDNRAIVALHGVMLKQPIASYYDPQSRAVFYFQNGLAEDRTVHVLGTNAMCYYSEAVRLRWADFMYRNMADIWLARYAQENKLPMIAASRDYCWVRQNTQATKFETIYEASLQKKKSFFDSSLVQDALVKHMAPLTMQPAGRTKVALIVCVWKSEDLDGFLRSWEVSRDPNIDWVLVFVICQDVGGDVSAFLKDLSLQTETHAITGSGDEPSLQKALALAKSLECDVTIVTVDRVRLNGREALKNLVNDLRGTRSSALAAYPPKGGEGAKVRPPALLALPKALTECPIVDARLEPALAVADWFARVREGSRRLDDAQSGALLTDASEPFEEDVLDEVLDRRNKLGPLSLAVAAPAVTGNARPTKINDLFERVVVLNLDRRPDRWNKIKERLERAGIKANRCRATDGAWPEIRAEYVDYAGQPLVPSPKSTRLIKSSLMFYKDYDSQVGRVAYEENMRSRKAIASPGAWAYLKSYIRILEGALKDRVESLLVFDDDVVFHKNFGSLFREAAQDLPEDWLILQLGTLQYHWEPSWVHWRTSRLYSTGGSAIGSHAVGMRFDAYPFLLDHAQRMQLPFDTGALSAATKAFADRCFVVSPNLAIQELADSDIGTSEFQSSERMKRIAETYRWQLSDYDYGVVDDVAAEESIVTTA